MAQRTIFASDISGTELTDENHVVIVVKIHPELASPRELDISVEELATLVDLAKLQDAPMVAREAAPKPRKQAAAARVDYKSPEWAGVMHRGKVTAAEAEWVRENLKAAQANRAREGQPPIDPESEADQKRYFS